MVNQLHLSITFRQPGGAVPLLPRPLTCVLLPEIALGERSKATEGCNFGARRCGTRRYLAAAAAAWRRSDKLAPCSERIQQELAGGAAVPRPIWTQWTGRPTLLARLPGSRVQVAAEWQSPPISREMRKLLLFPGDSDAPPLAMTRRSAECWRGARRGVRTNDEHVRAGRRKAGKVRDRFQRGGC